MKEVAGVAVRQAESAKTMKTSATKELTALRQQIVDLSANDDDKTTIAKLHTHIVALQVWYGMVCSLDILIL